MIVAAAVALAAGSCAPRRGPSNDIVFVSNEQANEVTLVDGATGEIVSHLATGPRPRGMGFSPDRRTFYVAASNADRIEAWNIASRRRVATDGSGTDPE